MSPFVRKVGTASGATAVQIVEKRNGQRRIVEHVGSAHDEVELAVLVSAAQQRLHGVQDEMLEFGPLRRSPAGPVVEQSASDVVWDVLQGAFRRLGFDVVEDAVFAQLVGARIIEPTSKVDTIRVLSLPGMGPMTAPTIRAFLGDGTRFATAKAAASYVGLTPSTWSSGTVVQPSRAITKEGPAVLRLAFCQAANGARRVDPQLAAFYQHLMLERGHCHTQATVAVARKLAERTWTVLTRGQPYQFRDTTGQAVTRLVAKDQARHDHAVPDDVRARARAHSAATHRSKLTK